MSSIERLKGSRYAKSQTFTGNENGDKIFRGVRSRNIVAAEGVIEHVLAKDERLDLLALQYYNDSSLWWRIVDANPDIVFSGDLMLTDRLGMNRVGTVIVIPRVNSTGGG